MYAITEWTRCNFEQKMFELPPTNIDANCDFGNLFTGEAYRNKKQGHKNSYEDQKILKL